MHERPHAQGIRVYALKQHPLREHIQVKQEGARQTQAHGFGAPQRILRHIAQQLFQQNQPGNRQQHHQKSLPLGPRQQVNHDHRRRGAEQSHDHQARPPAVPAIVGLTGIRPEEQGDKHRPAQIAQDIGRLRPQPPRR